MHTFDEKAERKEVSIYREKNILSQDTNEEREPVQV